MVPSDPVAKFIARWSHAEAAERAKEKEVAEILETLAALGRTHPGDSKGTYVR